jgi:subtilisin family serine protease
MRHSRLYVASLFALAVMFAGATVVMAGPSMPGSGAGQGDLPGRQVGGPTAQYVPGQVIVKYKPGISEQSRSQTRIMSAGRGAAVLNEIGPPEGDRAEVVKLEPGLSVEQAVARLQAQEDVLYAEPNYIYHSTYEPNDPALGKQWGFKNDGQKIKGATGTAGADIDAEAAWDIERGYSNPVTVAIIDTGCDFTHPDLKSKLLSNGYNYAGISQTHLNWTAPAGQWQNWYFAQSIKGTGGTLNHVGIAVQKVGSPTGKIYVAVMTSLPPSPITNPPTPLAMYEVNPSEVSREGSEIYKQLDSSVSLQNGRTYYIIICTDNTDPGLHNYYNLYYNYALLPGAGSSDKYLGGCGWYYNDTQGWQQSLEDDFYFRTNPNNKPRDDAGHGTHVAGIAAGHTNNGVGVAGTCPGAKVLPVKVLDASGSGSNENITSGIYYAANHGADIISMSLGGGGKANAMQEACNYAYNKGITVFASAGNSGDSTMNYPAGYSHVIGVGATTNKDKKADFSTYNSSVDVSAPGKDIYSTLPSYPVSCNADGYELNYDFLSGTSMACPMAAGVGALLKAHDPSLSPAQVEQMLESTADDLGATGRDNQFGYGRVNAARALGGGPKSTWYLAEGTTAWGFNTYMSIENPNDSAVTANVTYMTDSGQKSGPTVNLAAKSQATVNPGDTLGQRDFSTKVECKEGKAIAVDRTMTWIGDGAPSPEAHSSVGVTAPAKTWYLPEGSASWGFECWLLIQNPNDTESSCEVTYMIEGADPVKVTKSVPANSRKTFNIADDIGSKDASIQVHSEVPVIPERAMYRNNKREGHDSIGTTAPARDYYLAEGTSAWGFVTYVLVQNPNTEACDVTITYMTSSGPKPQASFNMAANSRKTVRVNDVPGMASTDFSTAVHGTKPIIAERAMYWGADTPLGEACHDSIGMDAAHATFYLPDGQTSDGRETWTLVQNPNSSPVTVEITYMTTTGAGNETFQDTIPANSRKTFNMVDKGISGRAAIMVTSKTAGKKIMVERAMYWNNRGAGTDTIGGYSD